MTTDLFSQLVPITLAMALPLPVLKSVRYLLGGRPIAHSLLMVVTWGSTFFVVLGIATLTASYFTNILVDKLEYSPSSDASGVMHIIIGLLLLVIGSRKFKKSLELEDVSIKLNTVDTKPLAIIKATVKMASIGLKNSSLMFFIAYLLIKSDLEIQQGFIVSGLVGFTSMIWISMPLIVYLVSGHERDRVLDSFKYWILKNMQTLLIMIYIFIGISVLSTGIGELIPKLLETVFEITT